MAILAHQDPDPLPSDDETTSLLAGTSTSPISRDSPPPRYPAPPNAHPAFLRVALICIASIFLVEIGDYMQRAPLMRILEDIICRRYYESAAQANSGIDLDLSLPIPERECKGPVVQSELAMLRGWDMTFSCVPGLLLAVPYGVIADRWGRKVVLILGLLGAVLGTLWWITVVAYFGDVVDLRWIWASNFFLLIGGGSAVIKSMYFAMLADVATEERRASVFFQLMAAALISTVIGVPSAWWLMKKSLWAPMWIGLILAIISMLTCFFLPETLEHCRIPASAKDSDSEEEVEAGERPTSSHQYSRKKKLSRWIRNMRASHFILKSPTLFALSITFMIQNLGGYANMFLFQLASERFHIELGEASFLIPISAVTQFLILVVALPSIYYLLRDKFHFRPMTSDLIVVRGSVVFLIVGLLGIAFSPRQGLYILGTIILACGAGFSSATRSLVTSLVHPDEVSRLYGIMATIETIGTMVYGPILSKTFGWGLDLGPPWTGMVFLVVAALYAVIGLPVWLVGEPTPDMDVHG